MRGPATLLMVLLLLQAACLLPCVPQPQYHRPRYLPPEREYREEGYDAVWLVRSKRVVFNGTHLMQNVYYRLKILTDAGADRYFERRIVYNRDWQTLVVHAMRTIQPDGTVLEPMPDAIQDLPLVRERIYDNARQRVYQMPGVRPNSVIEANYTVIERFPIEGEFQDAFTFQDSIPTRYARYVLVLPPGYEMFRDWRVLVDPGVEGVPIEFTSYPNNTYVWEARNVPATLAEEGMPPLEEIVPFVAVSSIDSWEEIGEWWWGLVRDVIRPEEVAERASELVEGVEGVEERIAALYHWVEKNIKYVALEFGLGGFRPYEPSVVLENLYGDCKDGATLLVSMLRAVNITAYPVLICLSGDVDPEFPVLAFDHAIVAVPLDGELYGSRWLFLDTTTATNPCGNLPVGDQGKWALIVGVNETRHVFTQTPIYPPGCNRFTIRKYIVLDENGDATGMVRWEATGSYDWALRYLFRMTMDEDERRSFLEGYVTTIAPGARLIHYEFSDLENYTAPFSLTMTFKAPGFASRYGEGTLAFRMPVTPLERGLVKREWRYYPYVLGFPSVREEVVEVVLPKGWRALHLPSNLTVVRFWGSVHLGFSRAADRVVAESVVRLVHDELPRRLYNEYVDILDRFAKRLELPVMVMRG